MHQLLKSLSGSRAYRRAFFSFIALLTAVVVAVSCFFYFTFLARQREETSRNVEMRMLQIEEQMNERLNEMLRIVLSIDRNNANGVFTYAPLTSQTQRENLQEEMERLIANNSFVKDMSYLSLQDADTIYSTQGPFRRETFEKYVYGLTEAFDAPAFAQRKRLLTMCTLSASQLRALHEPFQPMAFVYGLPFMASNQRRFITFYVDKAQVDALICRLLPCEVEEVRIYERDALVYSLYGREDTEGLTMFSHASGSTAYHYQLLAQDRVVYADYYRNLSFFFALIGVTLLVIVLSGGMVALYNVSPLYRLLRRLGGQAPGVEGSKDEMALLGDLVEDAILEKQRLARGLFVSNLVWEQYETRDALDTAAQAAGVAFEYPLFTCCCARYAAGIDGHALCQSLEEALDTVHTMVIAVKRHGQERFTVLINHTAECAVETLLRDAFTELRPAGLRAGISGSGQDVLHLSALHEQARIALHYAADQGLPLVAFASLPKETAAPHARKEQAKENDLKDRILGCIERNLRDNSLSLESIAGECGISASYLVRYFRGCMGATPMQYVDTLRMDIAKSLLTTTGCTLREVVEQCGYLDESNFARKFKKQEGMTPMSYRRENWRGTAEETSKK